MIFFTIPSTLKYKKMHKLSLISASNIYNNQNLCFGEYGIMSLEVNYISIKQINAIRKMLLKKIKKTGKLLVRFSPNFCFTAKPAETRMGKGKGNATDWVYPVKVGQILFEIKQNKKQKLSYFTAKSYFDSILIKSPLRLKFISIPKYALLDKKML